MNNQKALDAHVELVEKAQSLLASYLPPDGISPDQLINGLLDLFGGPEQRVAHDMLSSPPLPLQRGEAKAVAPYPHEHFNEMAAARYKVMPTTSGFWPYAVKAGDGEAVLYTGHKNSCELAARRLTGAFLDGAFAYYSALAAPIAPALPVAAEKDAQREAVMDAISDALGDAMDCTRVWSAWGVGTMSQNDFQIIREDADRLAEVAVAAIAAMQVKP